MAKFTAEKLYELGDSFYYGFDFPQDQQLAAELFLKAAELGHAPAQCQVATMYELGEYFEESRVEASKWYCKAAIQGDNSAMSSLKVCMEFDANDWRKEHMVEGSPEVVTIPIHALTPIDMYRIGTVYHHGFHSHKLDKDYAKAVFWWKNASLGSFELAELILHLCENNSEL